MLKYYFVHTQEIIQKVALKMKVIFKHVLWEMIKLLIKWFYYNHDQNNINNFIYIIN